MDPVAEFCLRVVGPEAAAEAVAKVRRAPASNLTERLTVAGEACRALSEREEGRPQPELLSTRVDGLRVNVARELHAAVLALPERQREALALRDGIGLGYGQIAAVMGVGPPAVGPLLARARLRFRAERRQSPDPADLCGERQRAAVLAGRRIDGEAVSADEQIWLEEHVGTCPGCARAQLAMLEAATCLRVWPVEELAGADAEMFRLPADDPAPLSTEPEPEPEPEAVLLPEAQPVPEPELVPEPQPVTVPERRPELRSEPQPKREPPRETQKGWLSRLRAAIVEDTQR